jgi:hypothetical protein
MVVSASELRQNIYRLLDQVLETGIPLEIERNGRLLRVVATDGPAKLDRLMGHGNYIVGDAEDLVHVKWSGEWHPRSCSLPMSSSGCSAAREECCPRGVQRLPLAWWADSLRFAL